MSIVEKAIDRMKARAPEARAVDDAAERAAVEARAERRTLPVAVDMVVAVAAEPQPTAETLHYRHQDGDAAGFNPQVSRVGQLRTQLRALRRRVLDATAAVRDGGRAPVVAVTSAAPGEGKSFTAFHLAMSLTTEAELSPVLVDADLVRQQATRLFSNSTSGGLAACLEREQPLAGAVCLTDIHNLCVVPAGPCSQAVIEQLGGGRWNHIVAEMHAAGSRSIFVIDTPPVLATSEAQYLARSADLVLFVVRSEASEHQAVAESLERLGPSANVAFVFNGRVSTGSDVYYGYSYYGSADENEPPKD